MGTNSVGVPARLFPWQTKHYIVRGGPNDPVSQASGGPPVTTGGSLGFNSVLTVPPIQGPLVPPAIQVPRVQSLLSAGALAATGILSGNTGGLYVGTIPGGAWIDDIQIYCYTALAGGTAVSVGLFYAPAGSFSAANSPGFQPATLFTLGFVTSPVAGHVYSAYPGIATNEVTTTGGIPDPTGLAGAQIGPGNGVAGAQALASLGPTDGQGFAGQTQNQASSLNGTVPNGDIDLYFVNFLIAGSGTAPTAGEFAFKIEFTGLAG
jgi:hypothetical protein